MVVKSPKGTDQCVVLLKLLLLMWYANVVVGPREPRESSSKQDKEERLFLSPKSPEDALSALGGRGTGRGWMEEDDEADK